MESPLGLHLPTRLAHSGRTLFTSQIKETFIEMERGNLSQNTPFFVIQGERTEGGMTFFLDTTLGKLFEETVHDSLCGT